MNYDNYLPPLFERLFATGHQGNLGRTVSLRGVYIEGVSPRKHQWEKGEAYDEYMRKYDHPMWKEHYENARNAGHGGIDYFTIRSLQNV